MSSTMLKLVAELKAKRRIPFFNAYVNLMLGHKVPYTLSDTTITNEAGKSITLRKEELESATKKIAEIKEKRASKKD